MTDDKIHVYVNTEVEEYPVLGITQIGNPEPDQGFVIPHELLDDLGDAYEAVNRAEKAIMRHIAANYPDAEDVHEWLRIYGEPEMRETP